MQIISSARASTDTRHRIAERNSLPRRIRLIGLGTGGAALAAALDTGRLRDVQVLPVGPAIDAGSLAGAEMIFLVACPGDDVSAASAIRRVAREANVMVTAILVDQGGGDAGLPLLRAASDMLIVASDASYVPDMLDQLGA
jgi:pyrimidine operon attenuation protein/uracil phosphoribosyltransferase